MNLEDKKVEKVVLRYVVPFKYESNYIDVLNDITHTDKDISIINTNHQNQGKLWNVNEDNSYYSNLYSYVSNEFSGFDGVNIYEERSGATFVMEKEVVNTIPSLYWLYGDNSDVIPFSISNMGLYVFRNHLGFIWYEVKFDESMDHEFSIHDIEQFQHSFRNLNPSDNHYNFCIETNDTEIYLNGALNNNTIHMIPISMGAYIRKILIETLKDTITFLPDKENVNKVLPDFLVQKMKNCSKKFQQLLDDNKLNEYLEQLFGVNGATRSILFTYLCAEGSDDLLECSINEDKRRISYYLTNGYNDSYLYSDKMSEKMQYPFDDVVWYSTCEGTSIISWPYRSEIYTKDNLYFLSNLFPEKIRSDYFHLFIKAIYETYSLLLFSEEIQNKISDNTDLYKNKDSKRKIDRINNQKQINNLVLEIELFLTKSVTATVSYIDHQDDFYNYLTSSLRINEQEDSVTKGLESLGKIVTKQSEDDEKEREERSDNFLQAILSFIGTLQLFSVLCDWQTIRHDYDGWAALCTEGFARFIGACMIIGVICFFYSIFKIIRKNKSHKDD